MQIHHQDGSANIITTVNGSASQAAGPCQPASEEALARPKARRKSEGLLDELIQTSIGSLADLRDSIDLSLDEIANWIRKSENRYRVASLVELLDAQTQLLICQHRVLAVARLVEVAQSADSPETIRRACADLLRIRLVNPYLEDKRPAARQIDPEAFAAHRGLMARLSRNATNMAKGGWGAGRE